MNFNRYFRTNQQLLLQAQENKSSAVQTELLMVTVASLEGTRLVVNSPYGAATIDQYAIEKDSPIEITTEVMGMGARVTGRFEKKLGRDQFALQLDYDLSLFQRRIKERLDCELGIRFSRAEKTLDTMRDIWQKNLKVLHSPEAPLIYQGFKPCRVNISSGGIRFAIKPPANQGDLCLILLNLDDGKPPVCAISEVIWSCMVNENAVTAGMRFINILTQDQERISALIQKGR